MLLEYFAKIFILPTQSHPERIYEVEPQQRDGIDAAENSGKNMNTMSSFLNAY